MVNKDQVKGALKEAEGRIQDAMGDLTGNKMDDLKGKAKVAEGKLQRKVGDIKEETARQQAKRIASVKR